VKWIIPGQQWFPARHLTGYLVDGRLHLHLPDACSQSSRRLSSRGGSVLADVDEQASLGVWHAVLDGNLPRLRDLLDEAEQEIEAGRRPAGLCPGTVWRAESSPEPGPVPSARTFPARTAQKRLSWPRFVDGCKRTIWPCPTTGYLSRHLFAVADRPRIFYMQGSMGHAAAIALGYCTARSDANVVVIDGDGALLMHLGILSTIGAAAPRGLTHVVAETAGTHRRAVRPRRLSVLI
jgi:phosphonopyruvate decarboxylase